jgi:hypothetical protein
MIGDLSVGTALRYNPTKRLTITPSLGTYVRSYRYDTADAAGYNVNSPFGFNYGLSASYVFTNWLAGVLGYSQVQRLDYHNDWRTIQSASAQLSASVTDSVNAVVGYRWRDLTLSNESLFDDDRVLIYTGVSYAF